MSYSLPGRISGDERAVTDECSAGGEEGGFVGQLDDHCSLLIGLTGNIGTGKTTVADMLAELGAEIVDADTVAHEVMRDNSQVRARIAQVFGPEVLGQDGEIDRKELGALVFADPEALARLETIVHPATLEAIHRCVGTASADVVVIEAIKLIEVGIADACDSVWVTACRPEQQVTRIMEARGLSRAEAELRVRAQPPQEEKVARADVVIDTSGTLSWTRTQVYTAWGRLADEGGAHLGRERHSEYNCTKV
jgi:dephospho-CoA kinase